MTEKQLDSSPGFPCPVCASLNTERLYTLQDVPVFCNVLHDTKESAVNNAKGVIDLLCCNGCGHLFNGAFDPELMNYSVNYENSLHFSHKFQEFAFCLAKELIGKYNLFEKHIIEIGCGKGDFLKIISKLGSNSGYGFDASYEFNDEDKNLRNITFYQEFYSDKYAQIPADLVLCRHVLEHINTPKLFVEGIASVVNRYQPVFYFEVPNALYTLRDAGIWDIIYEHYSYYTPTSLSKLFSQCNFQLYSLKEVYNQQFLSIEFGSNKIDSFLANPSVSLSELKQLTNNFRTTYDKKINYWRKRLDYYRKSEKKVALWGGGSKGVTFLNVFREFDFLEEIVDINPKKQGKFVSGTGQKYISPEALREKQYDTIIVMNPIYTREISNKLKDMGLTPELIEA